jgi:hypothetical protein
MFNGSAVNLQVYGIFWFVSYFFLEPTVFLAAFFGVVFFLVLVDTAFFLGGFAFDVHFTWMSARITAPEAEMFVTETQVSEPA